MNNDTTIPKPETAEQPAGKGLDAAACSACGQFPKIQKTAIPDAMQLSHLCREGRDNDFGEFGEEAELISLWNNQQNAQVEARR